MMPVPITPDIQIIRSTKNTWSSFFHTPSVKFFESSDLKTAIAAALNQPNTNKNVIAPQTNKTKLELIQYDFLYLLLPSF